MTALAIMNTVLMIIIVWQSCTMNKLHKVISEYQKIIHKFLPDDED